MLASFLIVAYVRYVYFRLLNLFRPSPFTEDANVLRGRKCRIIVPSGFRQKKVHKYNKRITSCVFTTVNQVAILKSDQYTNEDEYSSFDSDSAIVVVDNCANSHIWNDCSNFENF